MENNIREIFPLMVNLSNNSRITQQTAQRVAEKFSAAEFNDFRIWLRLVDDEKKMRGTRWNQGDKKSQMVRIFNLTEQ